MFLFALFHPWLFLRLTFSTSESLRQEIARLDGQLQALYFSMGSLKTRSRSDCVMRENSPLRERSAWHRSRIDRLTDRRTLITEYLAYQNPRAEAGFQESTSAAP